jgi:hypothetical protein
MIELAERPSETKPPELPAGWYDPDSSAFEPFDAVSLASDEPRQAGVATVNTIAPTRNERDDRP